jgi:Arc/MetJ family transcription regulator
MRTNIEVEATLIDEIMQRGKIRTKKAAVQKALENYLKKIKRDELAALAGKVTWEGNLDEMRVDRNGTN